MIKENETYNRQTILGKRVAAPKERTAEVLQAIPREEQRNKISLDFNFKGTDLWNVWDAYWVDCNNQAHCCLLQLEIDASSKYIVESKSLKHYLEGITWIKFENEEAYLKVIVQDLSECLKDSVVAKLIPPLGVIRTATPGLNLDNSLLEGRVDNFCYNKELLKFSKKEVESKEHINKVCIYNTDTFRSLCPVTNQPDYATVVIASVGEIIDPENLLRYLQSYRNHTGFHENCCERIFDDLRNTFSFERLSVIMAFSRRGGIDITPMRWLDGQPKPEIGHLWRQ